MDQQHHSRLNSQEDLEDGHKTTEHTLRIECLRMIDVLCRRLLVQVVLAQHHSIYISRGTANTLVKRPVLVHSTGTQVTTGTTGHGQLESDKQVKGHDGEHDQPLRPEQDNIVEGAGQAILRSYARRTDKNNEQAGHDQISDTEALQDTENPEIL